MGKKELYPKVNYAAIEKLQQAAAERADRTSTRLKSFESAARRKINFNSRHRMKWEESFAHLCLREAQLADSLQAQMATVFLDLHKPLSRMSKVGSLISCYVIT